MAKNKIIEKIPQTEKICVNLYNKEKLTYVITEKNKGVSKEFSIYEIKNEKEYLLLGKGDNPLKLEEKFVAKNKSLIDKDE